MKELLTIVTELAGQSASIAFFRSHGAELPNTRWLLVVSAVFSILFVLGEQLARGHGLLMAILVACAWVGVAVFFARDEYDAEYRLPSTLLLGTLPVCVALIMVAGNPFLELVAQLWGIAVCLNVVRHYDGGFATWR